MNNRVLALLAALGATTIYGMNHTIAKVVMPHYIGAFGFIMLRVVGAAILFWMVGLFTPKEKIDRKDYLRIFGAALLGMCINMLMFFKGLQLSTPINSGVIVTLTPIIILILSAYFLKERLTRFNKSVARIKSASDYLKNDFENENSESTDLVKDVKLVFNNKYLQITYQNNPEDQNS